MRRNQQSVIRHLAASVVSVALVATACGGGDGDPPGTAADDEAEAPDTIGDQAASDGPSGTYDVTSDDGGLTLSVPSGAASTDVDITANPVDVGEVDASLAGAPGVFVYDLQPSGSTFATPLTATVRTGVPASDGVAPLVVMALEDGGGYAALDVTTTVENGEVVATAEVPHFSRLVTMVTGVEVSIPATVDGTVGQSIDISVTGVSRASIEDDDVLEPSWSSSAPLAPHPDGTLVGRTATFVCATPAEQPVAGAFSVLISARPFDGFDFQGQIRDELGVFATLIEQLSGVSEVTWSATLTGAAACHESAVPDETTGTALLAVTGDGTCDGFDGFLAGAEAGVTLLPSDQGWRLVLDGLTGSFFPDGNGGLRFEDRVGSTSVGDQQPIEESVTIVSIDGDVVTFEVTRTRFPDEGDPCTEKFTGQFTLPSGWVGFLVGLPAAGPTTTPVDGFELTSADGKLKIGGSFSGASPGPITVRVLFSGLEESTTTIEVTPGADGTFDAEVDVGIGWCYVQVVRGGHVLAEGGVDCE